MSLSMILTGNGKKARALSRLLIFGGSGVEMVGARASAAEVRAYARLIDTAVVFFIFFFLCFLRIPAAALLSKAS